MACKVLNINDKIFDFKNKNYYENDNNLKFLYEMINKYNIINEEGFLSLFYNIKNNDYLNEIYDNIYLIKFFLYKYHLWTDLEENLKKSINFLLKYFIIEKKIIEINKFDDNLLKKDEKYYYNNELINGDYPFFIYDMEDIEEMQIIFLNSKGNKNYNFTKNYNFALINVLLNIPNTDIYKNYDYKIEFKKFKIIKYFEIIKKYMIKIRSLNNN